MDPAKRKSGKHAPGLKVKDLVGIPWRVAFALQADGWYLRSDIIWAKPNPMPESVTDRPTKAHEYLFLLTKSARYHYDAEAVREPHTKVGTPGHLKGGGGERAGTREGLRGKVVGRVRDFEQEGRQVGHHGDPYPNGGRNKRSVWEVATQPFPGAHFAVFPPALIKPCVLAGTSPKACGECGAPYERITERDAQPQAYEDRKYDRSDPRFATKRNMGARYQAQLDANPKRTIGFRQTCDHDDESGRCLVLDPFTGSGTTGLVAIEHGCDFIGIELNEDYAAMSRERIGEAAAQGRLF